MAPCTAQHSRRPRLFRDQQPAVGPCARAHAHSAGEHHQRYSQQQRQGHGCQPDQRAGFEGRAGTSSGAVPHKEGTHVQAGPAPPLKAPRSRRITFSGFLRDVALLLNDRANDLDAVFPSFGRFTPPQAASAGIDSREMVQFHHPLLGADLDRLLAIGGIKPPFGISYLTSITCRNPGPCAPRT